MGARPRPWRTWGYPTVKAVTAAKSRHTRGHQGQASIKDMVLVNNSRLSVQPVKASEWKTICKMAGV